VNKINESSIKIPVPGAVLNGDLTIPGGAQAIILFAHGSGSGRKSPRNRYVAGVLQKSGFATLLLDLLTPEEEEEDMLTGGYRFNINLLSRRLMIAANFIKKNAKTKKMNIGYFGASTGAAAALVAAAEDPDIVYAITSRGGRPDMAEDALFKVKAPTLLIVGGEDYEVIEINKYALKRLKSEKKLMIVPGATHLFEEPGALEEVSRLAADWFAEHIKNHGFKQD